MHYSSPKSAFSLLELSIVLVVSSLLLGGVLAGKSIIHGSEMRSVTTQLSKYNSAVNLFQTEFKALPGDMTNATQYWGNAGGAGSTGSDAACIAANSTGSQATCNGNGDGQISDGGLGGARYEIYRAWQHLANAGMVEGTYSGVDGASTNENSIPGTNTPAGRIAGSGFDFWYVGAQSGTNFFAANYGNVIAFGGTDSQGDLAIYKLLTATDAQSIDQKLDDGNPATGIIMGRPNGNQWDPNCITATGKYNTQITQPTCSLMLITGY